MSAQRSTSPISSTSTQHLRIPTSFIRASVITTPPWARDEPPSPTLRASSSELHVPIPSDSGRPSDVGSYNSTLNQPSRWWSFTSRRPRDPPPESPPPFDQLPSPGKTEKRPFKFPLPPAASWRDAARNKERQDIDPSSSASATPSSSGLARPSRGLKITLPAPPVAPFTVHHNATPGWDTPWTSRPDAQGRFDEREFPEDPTFESVESSRRTSLAHARPWKRRRKRFRNFILHNTYVPLLFRMVNMSLTLSALVIAVRIRQIEHFNSAMGAVGSSPTLVIIFAPLTLLHVMTAIYLEYFGRPLGLWRTSGKMFHTLFDVVLICAWSAALSLCFDNFFTSLIPCASEKRTTWYNDLPRPTLDLHRLQGSLGESICDSQKALIILVTVGLVTYCINLVISLFRIVEKVKYHPGGSRRWTPST